MAERNIVVGPSAPPMMPIDAASLVEKSIPISGTRLIARAPQKATKMPTCAAPPRSSVLGFAIIGGEVGERAKAKENQGRQYVPEGEPEMKG